MSYPPAAAIILIAVAVILIVVALLMERSYRSRKSEAPAAFVPEQKISIIIPFSSTDPQRLRIFDWVYRYWTIALPEAEIIVAGSDSVPFHKTRAVNEGLVRTTGDIIVIMDADCYMSAQTIRILAGRIRQARREGRRLWYIPYRRFYRLTQFASELLLDTPPKHPLEITDPPPPGWAEHVETASSGHWWGALIQVMPREAFVAVDGMDERFRGWGGEDVSFMFKVDTLWGKHKTFNGPVFHIWHPIIKGRWKHTRQWVGQTEPEINDALAARYLEALGDPARMKQV